jgi:hypothetical protein
MGMRSCGREYHVDVGDVVQLPPARLAHADDREPARRRRGRQHAGCDRERGLQRMPGEVSEVFGDRLQMEVTGKVSAGNGKELAAVGAAQGGHRIGRQLGRRAHRPHNRIRWIRPDRLDHPDRRACHIDLAEKYPPVLRMLHQVFAQRYRGTQQRNQSGAQLAAGLERRA